MIIVNMQEWTKFHLSRILSLLHHLGFCWLCILKTDKDELSEWESQENKCQMNR